MCLVITGWVTLIMKITGALIHVVQGSQIIYNKNKLYNCHHQYLPKLLLQQLCDIANMCVALLCVRRLAIVHCINCLSEPVVLMWHKLWQGNTRITYGLYHSLSWEVTQPFIHIDDHTDGHICTTHIHIYSQTTYIHTYTVTHMYIYILNSSVKASSKGMVANITH